MFQFHSLLISICYLQLHLINYLPSFCFSFHSNQAKTASLLSVEMTNTVMRMKKKDVSFSHVGPGATFSGSFNKSSWIEERALFFLGTKNTEQSTRKHSSITLIQARRDRSLNINRSITRKYPAEAKKVKEKTSIRLNINTSYTTLFRCIPWIIIWQGKSERSDWFSLGRDFTIRTVSTETIHAVYFFFGFQKPANLFAV